VTDAVSVGDRHARIESDMNIDKEFDARFAHKQLLDLANFGVTGRGRPDFADQFLVRLDVHEFAGAVSKQPPCRIDNCGDDDQRRRFISPDPARSAPADQGEPDQDGQCTEGIAAMVPGIGDDRLRSSATADSDLVAVEPFLDRDVDAGDPQRPRLGERMLNRESLDGFPADAECRDEDQDRDI